MDLHFFHHFFSLPQVSQLLSTPDFFGCLWTRGRFVYFSQRNSFVILSQRMCSDFFFQPQKIDNFLSVCLKHAWHCLRSCPTCRKKAQDVSVKVSPSMYLSKSQKRNRVWPMNFPPRDRSDFFTPFGKRLSKIKSPRVTRCLSFFEFSIFVFFTCKLSQVPDPYSVCRYLDILCG